jgi:hypothetical protein
MVVGDKNSHRVFHTCFKKRLKWIPNVWGYSFITVSSGEINTEAWFRPLKQERVVGGV